MEFKLIMDVAGDPGDWSAIEEAAATHARRRPTDALLLMLHGAACWRRGDLKRAKTSLRDAMHHDGNELRAAPWLFEVLLLLDEKDDAEWVWEKAKETRRDAEEKREVEKTLIGVYERVEQFLQAHRDEAVAEAANE